MPQVKALHRGPNRIGLNFLKIIDKLKELIDFLYTISTSIGAKNLANKTDLSGEKSKLGNAIARSY